MEENFRSVVIAMAFMLLGSTHLVDSQEVINNPDIIYLHMGSPKEISKYVIGH